MTTNPPSRGEDSVLDSTLKKLTKVLKKIASCNYTVIIAHGFGSDFEEEKRVVCANDTRPTPTQNPEDKNAVWYIIVVLLIYTFAIVVMMVKYIKRERRALEESKAYTKYLRWREMTFEKTQRTRHHLESFAKMKQMHKSLVYGFGKAFPVEATEAVEVVSPEEKEDVVVIEAPPFPVKSDIRSNTDSGSAGGCSVDGAIFRSDGSDVGSERCGLAGIFGSVVSVGSVGCVDSLGSVGSAGSDVVKIEEKGGKEEEEEDEENHVGQIEEGIPGVVKDMEDV